MGGTSDFFRKVLPLLLYQTAHLLPTFSGGTTDPADGVGGVGGAGGRGKDDDDEQEDDDPARFSTGCFSRFFMGRTTLTDAAGAPSAIGTTAGHPMPTSGIFVFHL